MKKILTLTLACTMVMGLFLSGCAMKDEPSSSGTGTSNSGSSGQREVVVCGWGENIDEDLFELFEEKTGIKVIYQTAESNEMMYSKVAMGGSGYDVVVPSDYMIARMIQEEKQKLLGTLQTAHFTLSSMLRMGEPSVGICRHISETVNIHLSS